MKNKKILIFIDGSNLYHNLTKNFGHVSVDFRKLADFLTEKNRLVAVYYYSAPLIQKDNPEAYGKQQKFFSSISRNPKFEVKL